MARQPPFTTDFSRYFYPNETITPSLSVLLPASYRDQSHHTSQFTERTVLDFLQQDLSIARLNKIQNYLWIAGLPLPPRPLNFQLSVSRQIVLNENPDMHLVWDQTRRMHLKPLPRYLLSLEFWRTHICRSTAQEESDIYPNALGLLYSYIALIQHESDFHIAKEYHLLPSSFPWEAWTNLVSESLNKQIVTDKHRLNPRYGFGELRLSRLDLIYRIKEYRLLRGYYAFTYQTYAELFRAYMAPLSVTTIYFALALTAMQVGLATEHLSRSEVFQKVSWGFSVFSILAPLGFLFALVGGAAVVFVINFIKTLTFRRVRAPLGQRTYE